MATLCVLLAARGASAQEPQSYEERGAPAAAAPPAAPANEGTPSSDGPPPRPSPSRAYDPFQLKVTAGAMYRRVFTLPFYGGDVGLSLGAQPSEHAAFYGTAYLFRGRTEYGLTTTMVRIGGTAEAVFDRFRAGGGLEGMYLGFKRVGRGTNIDTPALGIYATLSLDVVQLDHSALFVGGRMDVDATWQGSIVWGPGAYLGFRYGSGHDGRAVK